MPWWKSPKSSSSTASSSSASPSSRRDTAASLWSGAADGGSHTPRLTRLRKLRHLSNIEVGWFSGKGRSANSTPVSRSPSNLDDLPLTARSSSSPVLLPHPLPLPSPRSDGGVESGRLSHSAVGTNTEYIGAPAAFSSASNRNNVVYTTSVVKDNIRLNIPARSAPASGFSSPVLSPRRSDGANIFPSAYLSSSKVPQAWSSPEGPSSDFITGFFSQTPAEKFLASPDFSPIYSPTTKGSGTRPRNLSAPSSPLHPKMVPDNAASWHDSHGNNVNVHPLPLPPGAPVSLSQHSSHYSVTKVDVQPANQWIKGKLIGSGTFGCVYLATNKHNGSLCAMKEVNLIPDDPKSAACIKQLQQEIRVLSQLEHPNIVQYYGSEIIDDRFYIYLEYVYPGSINKYVQEHCQAVSESVVRNFTRHILMGLAYLHSKDVMHRDIKGANLLVNSDGVVKLADFGMAKHLSEAQDVLSLKGTPYWMAPEVLQASMNKEVGYYLAVDIWSMGCTVIEMFTGQHPWSGFSTAAAMFKVLHESPQIPETLSPDGKDFLQLCFRRNPADRPPAAQLLEHPFVTTSYRHDFHGITQSCSAIKFSDLHNIDSKFKFITDLTMQGRQSPYGEATQTPVGMADSAASRHSPRSTLEVVPNFSPPHLVQDSSFFSGSSRDVPNGTNWCAGNPLFSNFMKPHRN